VYEWSLFTCQKEIYMYVEKCLWLFYRWLKFQSLSLTKLLEECVSNFMKTVDCKMNCKMNCKTIYMSFLLMSSCLLCSDNAFNLALFLNDDFFLKLVISKLRLHRLIVESSFELTFWTRTDIESSCSHFQLDSSRVAHIFNLTWLDSTGNWVNSIRLVKNSSLASRELNIEIFPVFCFCIIFLHYLFDRKSWRETWRLYDRESWREVMVESHGRELWRGNMKVVWWKVMKRSHEEKL